MFDIVLVEKSTGQSFCSRWAMLYQFFSWSEKYWLRSNSIVWN